MKGIFIYTLLLVLPATFSACNKSNDDMKLVVDYPIANVGENLSFSVKGSPDSNAKARWDMGDGSPLFSGSLYNNHSYSDTGSYTVTVLVFLADETVTLTKDVSIEYP